MAIRKSVALLATGLALSLATIAGCGTTATPTPSAPTSPVAGESTPPVEQPVGGLIGITMPSVSLERWNNDGAELQRLLKEKGYDVALDYADDKPELQIQQLENQINQGAKVLVVASIDGKVLGPTLKTAADKGIKIIGYDRLLMATPNIDYYATFDNEKVGNLQGQFIVDQLGLNDNGATKASFNIEPFAGSPDDNNAGLFFNGAWSVLKPYVDEKKLVVNSTTGQKAEGNWQDVGILAWKSATAQSEMENRLNSFYTDKKVDVVLSPNDSLALGIAQALDSKGYKVGKDWPILTGQDGDVANVQNILDGKQSMTVWKDTRALAAAVAGMVDQVIKGETVTVTEGAAAGYNNGSKDVPTLLLDPKVVVKDDVQSLLVDSGFIAADKLKFPK